MMKTDLRRLRSCCARSGLGFLSSGCCAVGELWRGKVDVNLLPSSAGHSPGLTVEGLNLLPASVMLMTPLG